MKVKIGNVVYDPNVQPIMIVLTKHDKEIIGKMPPRATKYCSYPDTMSQEEVEKFMKLVDDEYIDPNDIEEIQGN